MESRDIRDSTPLHWACFQGYLILIFIIYRSENAINFILALSKDLDLRDSKGLTPLHIAVEKGN